MQWVQVPQGDVSSLHKKDILYIKNNQTLEQLSQGHGRVAPNGCCQDAIGQGVG